MGTQSSVIVTREQAIDMLSIELSKRYERQLRIKFEGLSNRKLEDKLDEEFSDIFTNYVIGNSYDN